MHQAWATQWSSAPTWAAFCLNDHTPPSPQVAHLCISLPRLLTLLLTQLQTDCSHLHAALHKTGIHPTGLCDYSKSETCHHFLLSCPLHQVVCQHLQHRVGADGFNICLLLSNPNIIPFTPALLQQPAASPDTSPTMHSLTFQLLETKSQCGQRVGCI